MIDSLVQPVRCRHCGADLLLVLSSDDASESMQVWTCPKCLWVNSGTRSRKIVAVHAR